ncbi:MAG: hypothetical protein F6K24_19735 [Okeania sp. SIO2D1]|nr:hypothetical protein [Okeania sp. SIO2D1]
MAYKNKGCLAREQDAPTAVGNKNNENAPPPKNAPYSPTPLLPYSLTSHLYERLLCVKM